MDTTTNHLQQEGSSTQPPTPPSKKRKQQGKGDEDSATKKKRVRTRCSAVGCTSNAVKGGVCVRHDAKSKTCSHEGIRTKCWLMDVQIMLKREEFVKGMAPS